MSEKKAALTQPRRVWLRDPKDPNSLVPMSELSNEELQQAYLKTQKDVLRSHNKAIFFALLQTELEEEAERRGNKLQSIEEINPNIGDFFKKGKQKTD